MSRSHRRRNQKRRARLQKLKGFSSKNPHGACKRLPFLMTFKDDFYIFFLHVFLLPEPWRSGLWRVQGHFLVSWRDGQTPTWAGVPVLSTLHVQGDQAEVMKSDE